MLEVSVVNERNDDRGRCWVHAAGAGPVQLVWAEAGQPPHLCACSGREGLRHAGPWGPGRAGAHLAHQVQEGICGLRQAQGSAAFLTHLTSSASTVCQIGALSHWIYKHLPAHRLVMHLYFSTCCPPDHYDIRCSLCWMHLSAIQSKAMPACVCLSRLSIWPIDKRPSGLGKMPGNMHKTSHIGPIRRRACGALMHYSSCPQ